MPAARRPWCKLCARHLRANGGYRRRSSSAIRSSQKAQQLWSSGVLQRSAPPSQQSCTPVAGEAYDLEMKLSDLRWAVDTILLKIIGPKLGQIAGDRFLLCRHVVSISRPNGLCEIRVVSSGWHVGTQYSQGLHYKRLIDKTVHRELPSFCCQL